MHDKHYLEVHKELGLDDAKIQDVQFNFKPNIKLYSCRVIFKNGYQLSIIYSKFLSYKFEIAIINKDGSMDDKYFNGDTVLPGCSANDVRCYINKIGSLKQ